MTLVAALLMAGPIFNMILNLMAEFLLRAVFPSYLQDAMKATSFKSTNWLINFGRYYFGASSISLMSGVFGPFYQVYLSLSSYPPLAVLFGVLANLPIFYLYYYMLNLFINGSPDYTNTDIY